MGGLSYAIYKVASNNSIEDESRKALIEKGDISSSKSVPKSSKPSISKETLNVISGRADSFPGL